MTKQALPTLYSRNKDGSVQQWTIEIDGASYRQSYGKQGGKIVTKAWTTCETKNVGKSNETTPEEQCLLEAKAIWDKKIKSNYFEDVAEIDNGFLEPQGAKPNAKYIDKVDWSTKPIVDYKLNGVQCTNTIKDARSRGNEVFHAIPHIQEELATVFAKFPAAYIQGELFNPKYVNDLGAITEIVSVVRGPSDITSKLLEQSKAIVEYHVYDGYGFHGTTKDSSGLDRRIALEQLIKDNKFKYIKLITYKRCSSFAEMKKYADAYIAQGGEGVIIRDVTAPYCHGKTSALLKYKKLESAEFEVLEIEEGDGDWKGCAKAVWIRVPTGISIQRSKANVKGTMEHLREVYKNREDYVGKIITVEFQELSTDGLPLTPYTDLLPRDYE